MQRLKYLKTVQRGGGVHQSPDANFTLLLLKGISFLGNTVQKPDLPDDIFKAKNGKFREF